MNYHGYGLCVPDHPEFLQMDKYGIYLQHRWMLYYDWLKANGVIVPWFLGEGGHVGGSVSTNQGLAFGYYSDTSYKIAVPSEYVSYHKNEYITLMKRKPLYYPFSTGSVEAMNSLWLNPGQGWKGLINKERLIDELMLYFNDPIEQKNKEEGWQACLGLTPFQAGNTTDWSKFDMQGDPLRMLAQRYKEMQ
jgi:hypothetical protein